MNNTRIPPKSAINAFNDNMGRIIQSHGMTAGCLVTSAILSAFLTHYKIKHEVVCGYLVMDNKYFTEHVWVEVVYKKGVVKYDVYDNFLSNAFRDVFGDNVLRKVRDKPDNAARLQNTKEEIKQLEELIEGVKIFKEKKDKFYNILVKRDKKLHGNIWRHIITEITKCTRNIGFYVDLVQIIMP